MGGNITNLSGEVVRTRTRRTVLFLAFADRLSKASSCDSSAILHSCCVSSRSRLVRLLFKMFLVEPAYFGTDSVLGRRPVGDRFHHWNLGISVSARSRDILLPDVVSSVSNSVHMHWLSHRISHSVGKGTRCFLKRFESYTASITRTYFPSRTVFFERVGHPWLVGSWRSCPLTLVLNGKVVPSSSSNLSLRLFSKSRVSLNGVVLAWAWFIRLLFLVRI
jgi:hypothetical protein